MIPNRLILYRQLLTSKHLPYIKVYAIDSGGYVDSGEENHSFTESLFLIFGTWGLMAITVFFPQSRTHCTWKHFKSHYIPFLPPPYSTKAKKGREAPRINCPTLEWPSELTWDPPHPWKSNRAWNGKGQGQERLPSSVMQQFLPREAALSNVSSAGSTWTLHRGGPQLVPPVLCYRPTAENLVSSGHEEWVV